MQRTRWFALAAATSVAYLFLHQPVQLWVQSLRDSLGGRGFSALFLALAIGFVLTTATIALRGQRRRALPPTALAASSVSHLDRRIPIILWTSTLSAAAICYWVLVAVESELVHWPQFTLLFLLFFAWCQRPGQAAAWTGLAGLLDEGYQYWVLQAHWNIYLDWNDVVFNLVAAAFGVCLVTSFGSWRFRPWSWSAMMGSVTTLLGLFGVTLATLLGTGVVGIYRSQAPNAWLVLSRSDAPEGFWTFASWSRKDFHILGPLEGLIVATTLLAALLAIDGWLRSDAKPPRTSLE